MQSSKSTIVTTAALILLAVGATRLPATGQVQPAKPTPPAQQPVKPSQPNNPSQPVNPGQPTTPPTQDPNNPNAPARPDNTGVQDRGRFVQPFAFQSQQSEAAFNQSARRLAVLERKMQKNQEDLLRRLGEARQLTGERQSEAILDLLQQVLLSQKEWHNYITQSRTMLSGEIELSDEEFQKESRGNPFDPSSPSLPARDPRQPQNSPRSPK